jgi:transcriptional regulator with XRE-family HTH domain
MKTMPSKDRTLRKFGLNVARIRETRALSQDKLAEKADIDRTYLSGIERGVRNPGIKTVVRLSKALGVGVEKLCEGIGA